MIEGITNTELEKKIRCFLSALMKDTIPLPSIDSGYDDVVVTMWTGNSLELNVWFDIDDIEVHSFSIAGESPTVHVKEYAIDTKPEELLMYLKPKLQKMGIMKGDKYNPPLSL